MTNAKRGDGKQPQYNGPASRYLISKDTPQRIINKVFGEKNENLKVIHEILSVSSRKSQNVITFNGRTKLNAERANNVIAQLFTLAHELEQANLENLIGSKTELLQNPEHSLSQREVSELGAVINKCKSAINSQILSDEARQNAEKVRLAKSIETKLVTLHKAITNTQEESLAVKMASKIISDALPGIITPDKLINTDGVRDLLVKQIEILEEKKSAYGSNKAQREKLFTIIEKDDIKNRITQKYPKLEAYQMEAAVDHCLQDMVAAKIERAYVDSAIQDVSGTHQPKPRAVETVSNDNKFQSDVVLRVGKRSIEMDNAKQAEYVKMMRENVLTFGIGPQGTKKSFLPLAFAVESILNGHHNTIILARPVTKSALSLGLEPGTQQDKLHNHHAHLKSMISYFVGDENAERAIKGDDLPSERPALVKKPAAIAAEKTSKQNLPADCIQIVDANKITGLTLENAIVIIDEAQDATARQLDDIITRAGNDTKVIINGSFTQIHLQTHSMVGQEVPKELQSGLSRVYHSVKDMQGVGAVEFTQEDIVRSGFVKNYVMKRDEFDAAHQEITKPAAHRSQQSPVEQLMAAMLTTFENMAKHQNQNSNTIVPVTPSSPAQA